MLLRSSGFIDARLATAVAKVAGLPGSTVRPAPASSINSADAPPVAQRIGLAAAIYDRIFVGIAVLATSDGRRWTSRASAARKKSGMADAGWRPKNCTFLS